MIGWAEGQECSPSYFPEPSDGILPDGDSERVERVSLNDDETEIVSLFASGCGGPKGNAHPWISDDGDRVVFSTRSQTVAGESNPNHVSHLLMREVSTGSTFLITGKNPVTGTSPGTVNLANGAHDFPRMSGDGKWIVWASASSNLISGSVPAGVKQIYRHEVDTGTTTVLTDAGGQPRHGNNDSSRPFIDEDGRYAVFESQATNLWEDYGTLPHGPPTVPIFVDGVQQEIHLWDYDPQTGVMKITWVSVGQNANGDLIRPDAPSLQPTVSANGCFVTWESAANNLTAEGGNTFKQIFMRDMNSGEIVLVSKNIFGAPAFGHCSRPVVSRDGRWILFESTAADLTDENLDGTPDDTNGITDAFVWERATGNIVRVSVDSNGNQINDNGRFTMYPYISANGRFVFFTWGGNDFNKPSGGQLSDANDFEFYVHDRDYDNNGDFDEHATGQVRTIRVSNVPASPGPSDPGSSWSGGNCAASGDGRYVVFMSIADDFVGANDVGGVDTNGAQDCSQCGQYGCPADWGRDIFRRELYTVTQP